jgi:hypothetical protein
MKYGMPILPFEFRLDSVPQDILQVPREHHDPFQEPMKPDDFFTSESPPEKPTGWIGNRESLDPVPRRPASEMLSSHNAHSEPRFLDLPPAILDL